MRGEARRRETMHTCLERCYALGDLFKLLTPSVERWELTCAPIVNSSCPPRSCTRLMPDLLNCGFRFDYSTLIKHVRTSSASLVRSS